MTTTPTTPIVSGLADDRCVQVRLVRVSQRDVETKHPVETRQTIDFIGCLTSQRAVSTRLSHRLNAPLLGA